MLKSEIETIIYDMEKVAQLFEIAPFDIYLLGGAACILGDYTTRATMDYETTILSPYYKARAAKLEQFTYLNIYILSIEDIIISKIIRLEAKDIEDIDALMHRADKALLRAIIDDVLSREDLAESKKQGFVSKLPVFKEKYYV